MTHDELVEAGRRWLLKPWRNCSGYGHSACCVVLTEIVTGAGETPDVIGWDGRASVLLECKTSVSDFKADAAKYFRRNPAEGMGRKRYYAAPVGVLNERDIPDGWGFIEVDDAKAVHVKRVSSYFEVNQTNEIRVLLSLLRRLKVEPGVHVSIKAYQIAIERPKATATFSAAPVPEVTGRGRKPADLSAKAFAEWLDKNTPSTLEVFRDVVEEDEPYMGISFAAALELFRAAMNAEEKG